MNQHQTYVNEEYQKKKIKMMEERQYLTNSEKGIFQNWRKIKILRLKGSQDGQQNFKNPPTSMCRSEILEHQRYKETPKNLQRGK